MWHLRLIAFSFMIGVSVVLLFVVVVFDLKGLIELEDQNDYKKKVKGGDT